MADDDSELTGTGVIDAAALTGAEKVYGVQGGVSVRPSMTQIAAYVLGGGIPGAVGSGEADDTVALQAALDAVPGWGGEVRVTKPHLITASLRPKSGTRLVFAGGKLIAPDAGWPLVSTIGYGMINIDNKEKVTLVGACIYGTKLTTIGNTPKLIYIEDSTNIQILGGTLENTEYEGIWEGGTIALVREISVRGVTLKNIGYPATPYAQLPAIQMNAYDAVIDSNILIDVGVGIGASGAGTIVSNNKITGALTGIATGDGPQANAITFIGNTIEIGSSASTVHVGIYLGGGTGTPGSGLQNIHGNLVRMVGSPSNLTPIGIFSGTAEHIALSGNVIEIVGEGCGTNIEGSTNGTYAFLSGNIVRVKDEAAACQGFTGRPNGAGKTLTVVSDNNRVYGMTTAAGSFAFDYGNATGTLKAHHMNDLVLAAGGSFRSGATYVADQGATPINLTLP